MLRSLKVVMMPNIKRKEVSNQKVQVLETKPATTVEKSGIYLEIAQKNEMMMVTKVKAEV